MHTLDENITPEIFCPVFFKKIDRDFTDGLTKVMNEIDVPDIGSASIARNGSTVKALKNILGN